MRSVKTLLALPAGALLLAGLVAATAAPAQAAAPRSCHGYSCSGRDPRAMGCERDAQTEAQVRPAGGGPVVELRYSRRCQAAWASMRDRSAGWPYRLDVRRGASYTGSGSRYYPTTTEMTGSRAPYRACVAIRPSRDRYTCTRWFG
jgi:hypothetical protein